ncbi:protein phosphatase 2C domain-containing protein [Tsukamurella pseudospumae]|uniref:protein phosphatase 2C domain-containing protein n=1 Tax=Tsukamurella pseudospumae TaxID=239498 RepID=UPI0015862F7A|nr:protein phosphatase 2C domain-containing protein [Tsukamurella pseudospumae]
MTEPLDAVGVESVARTAVRGTISIAPMIVGDPSPFVEPKPTAQKFRSAPFRPDTVIDGWSTEHATVRAASLRGHLHRYNGAPRQDDVAVHALPTGRIVVAVADGVSSAVHAHVGATTAVRAAVQWVSANAAEIGDAVDWDEMFKSAAWAVVDQARLILDLDEPSAEDAEQHLATTLVAAVIDPAGEDGLIASVAGVGDSGAWLLTTDGEYLPLIGGKAVGADGLASSAVSGLPRLPDEIATNAGPVGHGDVLLLGTDGIGDPLGSGNGGVGDLFRQVLLSEQCPSLVEFAHAVDFSRETFDDDRTLVAVWVRGQSDA